MSGMVFNDEHPKNMKSISFELIKSHLDISGNDLSFSHL